MVPTLTLTGINPTLNLNLTSKLLLHHLLQHLSTSTPAVEEDEGSEEVEVVLRGGSSGLVQLSLSISLLLFPFSPSPN